MNQKEGVLIYSAKVQSNEIKDVRFQIYNNAFESLLGFKREIKESELYEIPMSVQEKT